MNDELTPAAHKNFIGSFRILTRSVPGGEFREFGGALAYATGLPMSLFNGCVIAGPCSADEFRAAVEWLTGKGVPYLVFLFEPTAPALAEAAEDLGLLREARDFPNMVLHPVPEAPPPPDGVEVAPVGPDTVGGHVELMVASGMPASIASQVFSPALAADPDAQLFVARLDGEPAGTALALRTGSVSGVYAVQVLERARRRGVGTALTWAAVNAGRRWGCDSVVLQASEMGLPLYLKMGFRTVAPYATFKPKPLP